MAHAEASESVDNLPRRQRDDEQTPVRCLYCGDEVLAAPGELRWCRCGAMMVHTPEHGGAGQRPVWMPPSRRRPGREVTT